MKKITIEIIIVFITLLYILSLQINNNPIMGDGYENIAISYNLLNHYIFSSQELVIPVSEMKREPTWPFLTSIVLYLLSFDLITTHELTTKYNYYFKFINILVISTTSTILFIYIKTKTNNIIYSLIFLTLTIIIYTTTPRIINYYNNEPLATLIIVLFSIALNEYVIAKDKSYKHATILGLLLGVLILTKAQFLFISIPLLFVILIINFKKGIVVVIATILLISPWLYRNNQVFDKIGISERGKTVLAVRLVLTTEPSADERLCMTYAFIHPSLQSYMSSFLGVSRNDFLYKGKCQKLNRETCFDMGSVRVSCSPFIEDTKISHYNSKIQYFYKGFNIGELVEKNELQLLDVFKIDYQFISKYLQTLPIFFIRGLSFSDYPILSTVISLSLFVLILLDTGPWHYQILFLIYFMLH